MSALAARKKVVLTSNNVCNEIIFSSFARFTLDCAQALAHVQVSLCMCVCVCVCERQSDNGRAFARKSAERNARARAASHTHTHINNLRLRAAAGVAKRKSAGRFVRAPLRASDAGARASFADKLTGTRARPRIVALGDELPLGQIAAPGQSVRDSRKEVAGSARARVSAAAARSN